MKKNRFALLVLSVVNLINVIFPVLIDPNEPSLIWLSWNDALSDFDVMSILQVLIIFEPLVLLISVCLIKYKASIKVMILYDIMFRAAFIIFPIFSMSNPFWQILPQLFKNILFLVIIVMDFLVLLNNKKLNLILKVAFPTLFAIVALDKLAMLLRDNPVNYIDLSYLLFLLVLYYIVKIQGEFTMNKMSNEKEVKKKD